MSQVMEVVASRVRIWVFLHVGSADKLERHCDHHRRQVPSHRVDL
jgi:hypothetical protein